MEYPIKFIGAGLNMNDIDKSVAAPYLRRTFEISDIPATAQLEIAVSGFYELFINGKNITNGYLAPFVSNPDHFLYVDTYDISRYLLKGKNAICILLGNGIANAPSAVESKLHIARFRMAPAMALRLEMGEQIIESDEVFKTSPSAILSDDYRAGVVYDARCRNDAVLLPEFDDSGWRSASVVPAPRGDFVPNRANPISERGRMKPVSIEEKDGVYTYNFPKNSSGIYKLNLKNTAAGQKITLGFFEKLWPNGLSGEDKQYETPDLDFGQTDIYICKGGESEEWIPSFTYHGFEYVKVKGITEEQATADLLTYIELSTQMNERGVFNCSDERANKIFAMALNSSLSNFQHILTDCPHREKNGWTADAALSAEHTLLFLEPENNFRQWMQMLRRAQADDGRLPGIIPTGDHTYDCLNGPAWDRAVILIPYYIWKYRNDTKVIEENSHAIIRYLDYLSGKIRDDGLIGYGLGDWSHVGRGAWRYKAPLEMTDTAVSVDMCEKAVRMFKAINKPVQSDFASALKERLKGAARERLLDLNTMTALGNCQTSQAMAIAYNIFEPGEESTAFSRLLQIIQRDGGVMDVGVHGARVLFHVLAAFGHADLAYKMITQSKFPSFGWLLDMGATALWENFMKPETKWVDSRNHQFWGDVSQWFHRWLAGIDYFAPEKRLNIAPQFVDGIDFADGSFKANEGEIRVFWKKEDENIRLEVSVPDDLNGFIRLPMNYTFKDEELGIGSSVKKLESGNYAVIKYK